MATPTLPLADLLNQRLEQTGRILTGKAEYACNLFLMSYASAKAALFEESQGLRTILGVISSQIYFTGWQAMPIISVLALATGGLIVLNSSSNFGLIGDAETFGRLMIVITVRELGPLVTALIVIARSGTAIASELGNMKVNRELEALQTMGINPLGFIVFPRLIGGIVSVACLAFYFSLISMLGGFLITSAIHDFAFEYYLNTVLHSLSITDLGLFFLKNTASGGIIFTVACYQGLQVQQSPTEVPQVTTQAVMISITAVTLFNLVVTTLIYMNQLSRWGAL